MNVKRFGMMIASIVVSFVLIGIGAAEANPAHYTGNVANRKQICMLQDTVQAREGLEADYNGKKYYLCCGGCLAAFEGKPARYSHATDPVNGQLVDKADAPVYAYQGRAYFFSSHENLSAFAKNPQAYLPNVASVPSKRP
jgi:YHS domain-containing protein